MKNFERNWSDAKKQFQEVWNALSTEELEKTHGDREALAGLLEHKYGMPHPQAIASVSEIMCQTEVSPELPESEDPKKINDEKLPQYPNQLYEEDLPPNLQLEEKNSK